MNHDRVNSHASTRTQRVPSLWLVYFSVGVLALVVYFLLPTFPQALLYTAIGVSTALAVVAGVAIHRPAAPLGWYLLAAGQVAYATGDVIYLFTRESTAVDLCYLSMYVFMIIALVLFVRRRIPRGDSATLIDPAMLVVAAGVVWWVYVIVPLTADGGATAMVIAYPVFDLLVLAVALRLILGTGARTTAFRLLATGLVLTLGTDVVYALATSDGTYTDGSWIDGGWILAYLLLGSSALHPSMRWLDSRAPAVSPPIGRGRLTLLVASALVPAVLLVIPGRAGVRHVPLVVGAAALLMVFLVTRLVALTASERERAIVDPLTGLHAVGVFRANIALESERALRSRGQLGVIVLELNHFRLIVETYGQPAGDRVLCEVAARLQALCRPEDLVTRAGPHRFGVLVADADAYTTAYYAEAIREAVAEPKIPLEADVSVRVTASLGLAVLPQDTPAPERLQQIAEDALATALAAGGNRSHNWRGPVHVNTAVTRR
jgi:two-component system cell cycle response regulator